MSSAPVLTVISDQVSEEGAQFDFENIGTFTDVVEGSSTGGGSTIGLNPNDFSALPAFDPAGNVVIDTDSLTIAGNAGGTTVMADTGSGSYEIAVFTFANFELDAGITITASGSRPLAILSQDTLSVFGTIDVSATQDPSDAIFNAERIAGPGGGNGGLGSASDLFFNGEAAAGAPADSVGKFFNGSVGVSNSGGGTGGGHGGAGGRAENQQGGLLGVGGIAFGDLAVGVQGGSGGATASFSLFGNQNLAGGGGGGGGIELGAVNQINIGTTGVVVADGGNGNNGSSTSSFVGSGGGGAGGGILLHSTLVTMEGLLSAAGGDAGSAPRDGGGGGGGEILIAYSDTNSVLGGVTNVVGGGSGLGTGGENGVDGVVNIVLDTPPAVPVIESYDFSIDWGDGSAIETGTATIDVVGVNIGDVVQGSFDSDLHTYADDGVYIVTVSVISDTGADDSETTDTETFLVSVANVDPVLANLATDSAAIGDAAEGDTVTLTADFSDVGILDTHTATIDWGDGTTSAGVVDSFVGSVTADHVYDDGGIYQVTLTLVDDDLGTAIEVTETVIAGVGLNHGVLQIVGTNDNDSAKVYKSRHSGDFKVRSRLGNSSAQWNSFATTDVTKIEILLGDGHDFAFVSRRVDIDAMIDGGDGDDLLFGGGGNDILLGGAGYDLLQGRSGRDLMIGGLGSDFIIGSSGEDILIAGTTAYDNNVAALDAIMAKWTSSRDYPTRVENITNTGVGIDFDDRLNGDIFLIAEGEDATVFDDEATDLLIGGRGLDLYFANLDGGVEDIAIGLRNSEILEELEEVDV